MGTICSRNEENNEPAKLMENDLTRNSEEQKMEKEQKKERPHLWAHQYI